MNLSDFHGLTFKIDCVTDARNLLLVLKNVNMKNPAEKNFLVHLLWLKNKPENGVLNSIVWCDTRDMTADGHTKGSIDRELLLEVMAGRQKFKHEVKKYVPHRKSQQEESAESADSQKKTSGRNKDGQQ